MATPRHSVYDLDQVTFAFGPILADGYSDNGAISIEQASAGFIKKVGLDGKVTRSKVYDESASITLSLMQTSAVNALMSAVYNLDKASPNGAGVGPLYIRVRGTLTVYSAAEAWISKAPDAALTNEATPREWIIDCAKLEQFHAG